jgi:hypothetical protein
MRPTVPPQSTPCRFRFTLRQTRTISAKRAEVHQNLSRRPSPHETATSTWPVTCRRGQHGVQTRGARAAEPQTTASKIERHARLRALSRSVGAADGVPGHGSVSVVCQLCCQARRELARSAHQPHTARCLQLHSQTAGCDHHADRRTQHEVPPTQGDSKHDH